MPENQVTIIHARFRGNGILNYKPGYLYYLRVEGLTIIKLNGEDTINYPDLETFFIDWTEIKTLD